MRRFGRVMSGHGVLVAGIGNIFLSDDGFGVEVAQRLLTRPVPEGVRVDDFGIRGVHLAYELLDGYDALGARRRGSDGRSAGHDRVDRAGDLGARAGR